MVELAVRASSAFAASEPTAAAKSSRRRRRRRRAVVEVSPIIETMDFDCYERISTEFSVGSWSYGLDEKTSAGFRERRGLQKQC